MGALFIAPSSPASAIAATTSLATGASSACVVDSAGAAHCWGKNDHGQLGDTTHTDSTVPVTVSGGLTFTQIAVGDYFSCGLITNGSAYCWGQNSNSQLGDTTTTESAVPVAVSGGLTFSQIVAGQAYACGLASGTVYC